MDIKEQRLLDLFTFGLQYQKSELQKNAKGVVRITRGKYAFEVFNFYFVHEILSQILEVLYRGYLPYIDLTYGEVRWDDWFEQPFSLSAAQKEKWPVAAEVFPDNARDVVWGPNYGAPFEEYELELCKKLYQDFVVIREDLFSSIADEYVQLLKGKNVLGVLCRGTDMVTLRLHDHPIQPTAQELADRAAEWMASYGYEYIYLATEEKRAQDYFEERFPRRILVNRREYYDDVFREMQEKDEKLWIRSAYPDNDAIKKQIAMSYLSSVVLLSSCRGLLAGNCSGSQAALYMNDGRYEHSMIYNLGYYP